MHDGPGQEGGAIQGRGAEDLLEGLRWRPIPRNQAEQGGSDKTQDEHPRCRGIPTLQNVWETPQGHPTQGTTLLIRACRGMPECPVDTENQQGRGPEAVEQQTLETKLRRTYRGIRHLSKISTV